MLGVSLLDQFPLRLLIDGVDYTSLLSENFTFSNVDPGGFEAASFSLPMDLPQILRNMNVRLDCGLSVAWEGRVKEIDRSLGNKTLVLCEGYGTLLKKASIAEVYIDQSLAKWQPTPTAEQINQVATGFSPQPTSLAADSAGTPAIVASARGSWTGAARPEVRAYYDSENIPISSLYYAWTKGANLPNLGTGNWESAAYLGKDNRLTVHDEVVITGAGPVTGTLTATTADRVFACVRLVNYAAGGEANVAYSLYWTKLAVYGRHGLSKRGAEPGGFYASDIVTHALTKCPGIQTGVIPVASNYIVPQAVYLEPVPVEQVISDMAKLIGVHWGVWESLAHLMGNNEPRLDFRPYRKLGEPSAWALRQECELVDIREDLENLYDKALVTYTEAAGVVRTVEVSLDNPQLDRISLHQTIPLNMGGATEASAKAYGEIVLALLQDQARVTGTAQVNQTIHKLNGAEMAPWMLRAGIDRLKIPDLPASDVWGEYNDMPISRVECSVSENGINTSISFGRGPNLVEELTARLERATQLAAVSGG